MKTCTKCKTLKPLAEFSKRAAMRDGHRSQCKECDREYTLATYDSEKAREVSKAWREANPEKHKESAARWRENNKERYRESRKTYYIRHPEQMEKARIRSRKWHRDNPGRQTERIRAKPDYSRHKANMVRAAKYNAEGSHTIEEWLNLTASYDYRCVSCNIQTGELDKNGKLIKTMTRDHIIALSKGGSEYITNIQPLCAPCNRNKFDEPINYLERNNGS